MSAINSVQQGGVQAAIARASDRTGVEFDYLLAQAKLESSLDPRAQARSSSAAGLYQFINGTWLETLDRHGASHGLGWADAAISSHGGRATIGDPAMRARVMALRFDPDASALMAAELARDNAGELRGLLGREPDHAELYMAHFLGAGGAREFLGALQSDPGQSAAALLPRPAAANRAIFFDGSRPRAVGEVMELMRGKIEGAKAGEAPAIPAGGPEMRGYAAATPSTPAPLPSTGLPPAPAAPAAQASARPSMADTLRATFGAADTVPGGERVTQAYAKFRAFGL